MKHLLLSLGVLLLSLPGHAQFTRTFTGSLAASDPVIAGNRLFRDGTVASCGTSAKAFPGVSLNTSGTHYDTYVISNPSTTTATCVTVTLAPTCTEGAGEYLFCSAYTGSFVPANLATNFRTDMGTSPTTGTTRTMGITVSPGEAIVVVVNGLTATATCSTYGLTVAAPIALPIRVSRDAPVALSAYPNPVADVLHITASKPGHYTLYNATGAAIKHISGTEVSLRDLPGGVYMLQQNETKAATRIVKL